MLLHKWCLFLMRMMSPLVVGLIYFFLIGVSSLSPLHHPQTYYLHPTAGGAVVNLKKNAIYSPSAKDYPFQRTKLPPTEAASRTSVKVSISSGPIVNNGSNTDIETTKKRIPKLNLSLRLKVRNGSEVNSTIVYLPKLSRSMTNFSSKSSVNKTLQPIIVSSHRRILLDPKEYRIRSASSPRPTPKRDTSSQSRSKLKRRKIPRNSTNAGNYGTKLTQASSKILRTTPAPVNQRTFQQGNSKGRRTNGQTVSESSVLVNIKNTNGNSSILLFSPTNTSKNQHNRRFSTRLYKRQGRNFDLFNSDSKENEGNSGESTYLSVFNKTGFGSIYNSGLRKKLFNTSHLAPKSNNVFSPSQDKTFSSEKYDENSLPDRGYSWLEKKAKNLTIYEILKPRLKSNTSSDEIIDFSPDQNSFSLQNDAAFHQIQDIGGSSQSSTSSNTTTAAAEEISNNTLITNGIEYESPEHANSMIIMPVGNDASVGIKYIMVNRNNFAIYPAFSNETGSVTNSSADDSLATSFLEKEDPRRNKITKANVTDENVPEKNSIFNGQKEENDNKVTYLLKNTNRTSRTNSSEENLSADGSEYLTLLYQDSDSIRRPKMTESTKNSDNTPFKNPKIDSKMFYDYFAKRPVGNTTLREFPYPEFRPGNMFRYSDIYQRKPILDVVYTRPPVITRRPPVITRLTKSEPDLVTEETILNPTTFNSLRTSVRVLSTYYPNRMQDVTMKFGNRVESTTLPNSIYGDRRPDHRNEDDPDDSEYRDAIDPGFTMEKLAYLLIGTCCGLSILCLFVVVIAIKCRRALVEKRLKAQFRKRMYQHERMNDMSSPWQQQMFDHFMYLHRRPGDSSCSSNTDSCNCRCVTWSLGPRNLDATRPLCPTSRNSLYLYGQKKLPFGAASTLRFESMLGRKRSSPENNQQKAESPNTDSSHENDSLDLDSDSREGDAPKQCTCIDYNVWSMPPSNVPRGFFTLCPNPRRYNAGNCTQHPFVELRTIAKDLPPPVTGSNYLDRSEGVVYWSSNDERLI